MRLEPVPTPCSSYDRALEDIQKSVDALRHELLWKDVHDAAMAKSDEIVPMTRWQWQKLFGHIHGLITELQIAERERVRKIMGQI